MLHGAGEAHADRMHAADSHLLNLEFTQSWLDRVDACGARLDARFTVNGGYLLQLGKRLHRELWSEEPLSALCIEGLALELIAGSAHATVPGQNARWLERALEYLRANFRESLTLQEVAERPGCIRSTSRESSAAPGHDGRGATSVTLRVGFACRELAPSEQPIVDIAVQAGFSDHSHMTRVFRAADGAHSHRIPQAAARGRSVRFLLHPLIEFQR